MVISMQRLHTFCSENWMKTKNQVEKKDCYKKNKMLKVC